MIILKHISPPIQECIQDKAKYCNRDLADRDHDRDLTEKM